MYKKFSFAIFTALAVIIEIFLYFQKTKTVYIDKFKQAYLIEYGSIVLITILLGFLLVISLPNENQNKGDEE